METAAKRPQRFYDRCGGPRGGLPGCRSHGIRSRSLAPAGARVPYATIPTESCSAGSTAGAEDRVQNAQWVESSGCPAGAGSGVATRASVRQCSPTKPAAACATHSAPRIPDSNALMIRAYATTQPRRPRHRCVLRLGLPCMNVPQSEISARAVVGQALVHPKCFQVYVATADNMSSGQLVSAALAAVALSKPRQEFPTSSRRCSFVRVVAIGAW